MDEHTNSVTISAEAPKPALSEADIATIETQSSPEPQEKILGKFNSQEDLATAYQSLEKKLHSSGELLPSDEGVPVSDGEDAPEPNEGGNDNEQAEPAGEDFNEALQAVKENGGELNEAAYESFEKHGYGKEIVDEFATLLKFKAEQEHRDVISSVGSGEDYNNMLEWAATNLSAEEVSTFNSIVDKGTQSEVKFAASNLNARMLHGTTTKGSNLVKADAIASSNSGAYKSQGEMLKDMSDPRYKTDSAFRDKVYAKVNMGSN